jgi:hypothetical protein
MKYAFVFVVGILTGFLIAVAVVEHHHKPRHPAPAAPASPRVRTHYA